ncbi:MAG: ADP-ribosylglycohydrolase family protein [Actinobacteria bacterium]|nr:ADP-ribosylglycohydrolase family protein [Actinomycetota bacterium]
MTRVDRIHGALVGAAVGDALGAATELRTARQIRELFGGEVTSFHTPPPDTFARGRTPGTVTDDFSQAYYLARAIIDRAGALDRETGRQAVLAWWADDRYREFAGPTTRRAIARLSGEDVEEPFFLYRGGEATNGAAMRIGPVGCVARSMDEAIDGAIAVSLATHDNHLAAAAAAVVAAGVTAGVNDPETGPQEVQLAFVVEACLRAAARAEARALELTHEVAGASVAARTEFAVQLARRSASLDEATTRIAELIGTGLKANEAVPAAVGILAAAPDAFSAVTAAVNAGDDTDTVATIVGALAGAAAGAGAFPADLTRTVDEVNGFDLAATARALADLG